MCYQPCLPVLRRRYTTMRTGTRNTSSSTRPRNRPSGSGGRRKRRRRKRYCPRQQRSQRKPRMSARNASDRSLSRRNWSASLN
ncbi:hypothetical protein DPMN_103383 [Dreissena polymorpha]|uniref:Uncharacterized protein n=1 Tax=Dreissena polymorpha TaxID=45954 RepID=A0A9D4H9N8_DREPO|nr:hypothetical protein DPMN_103383 [Dreissena polymorpha]